MNRQNYFKSAESVEQILNKETTKETIYLLYPAKIALLNRSKSMIFDNPFYHNFECKRFKNL